MTETVDDAPQGVVDTTEPVATPDTIAPVPGQGEEAGSPATEEPAPQADAPKETKPEPWFVKRLDKQRQDIAAREARIAELERQLRPAASAETAHDKPLTQADVDRLATERAASIAEARAFDQDCNSIAAAGAKAFPDFMASVGNLNMVGKITPALIEAVKEAGEPAQVLYQLGKDPDEAARILALSPARMGVALAKLAARPAPTPPLSKAPAPIKPVSGAATVNPDESKLSDEEWYRRAMAKGK